MTRIQLLQVRETLRDNGIMISFSGRLSQGLIEEYGQAVRSYLETEDRPKTEVFNVFSVFIEQTQNIKNYCSSKQATSDSEQISQSCIVTIGKNEDGYFISSGNLIQKSDLPPLTDKLDKLIALDRTGLKQLYKDKLREELPPGTPSAGIGLIDMARKATIPLEYTVTSMNDTLSFFTLKAVI